MMIDLTFILQFGITPVALFLGADSLYLLLGDGQSILLQRVVCILLRSVVFGYVVYTAWQIIGAFLLLTANTAWMMRKSTSNLRNWINWKSKQLKTSHHQHFSHFSASQAFQMHREINLLVEIFNDAYYILQPLLVVLALSIVVVCSYGTIQLLHNVPFFLFVILPVIGLLVTGIILAFYHPAALIHEDSREVLKYLERIKSARYWSKKIKSERSIRITIASLFYASVLTEAMFYWEIVECTITLILITR
jgi:hypothetical protein